MKNYQIIMESVSNATLKETTVPELKPDQVLIRNFYTVVSAGTERPIIHYREFRILPQVCYDLRFPVWSRNVGCEYDILIYAACWPASRRLVWDTLLRARALENQCYVCGVNRVGTDGNGVHYDGGSVVYSPKGERLASVADGHEGMATVRIDLESLHTFRQHFPVWKDADSFLITKNEG